MRKTKTITETEEIRICDFCENSDKMSYSPATCIVCGKEACWDCTHKQMIALEVKRPAHWVIGGSCPYPEHLWACPNCKDALTESIIELNKSVELAREYMSKFVRFYSRSVDAINREAVRRLVAPENMRG